MSLCHTVKALTLETIDFVLEFVVVAFSGAILFTIPWIRKCQKFPTRNSGIEVTIAVDRHPIEDEN